MANREKSREDGNTNKEQLFKGHNLMKKSHTCKESGTNLAISFWHLLVNLKNKLLKKLLKWANKKQNNFSIYNVASFFKKKKEKKERKNTCRYYYQNLDDMIYGS